MNFDSCCLWELSACDVYFNVETNFIWHFILSCNIIWFNMMQYYTIMCDNVLHHTALFNFSLFSSVVEEQEGEGKGDSQRRSHRCFTRMWRSSRVHITRYRIILDLAYVSYCITFITYLYILFFHFFFFILHFFFIFHFILSSFSCIKS